MKSIQIQFLLFKFEMSTHANFFHPQTISILFCLHENTKEPELQPRSQISQYLVSKILKITEVSQICVTNHQFEAQMLRVTNSSIFVQKYHENIMRIDTFNDFYRELSNMLKTLRSLRSNKLEQGNLVDFLIRRMYIYFEKLQFKEIVGIYECFKQYVNDNETEISTEASKENKEPNIKEHEFMLTKSIEEVKFNLQNYSFKENPEALNALIEKLSQNDHTFKSSYLKGLMCAEEHMPVESSHQIHRYFDRCLGNLFQEKSDTTNMSNKINHCILSTAYGNLKMGYLEQCLQCISEGLRISQNNSDEESINNCIIYLYKIASQLGKHREEILLAEHAITHSLNLSNIQLMVYSCFSYSSFEKIYNCYDPEVALLKSRNIHWTDALHFAKKKIYSNFESNCKNIYHSYRSLLIPCFMYKVSVLIHLPELEELFINPYFQRKELFQLEIYREYKEKSILEDKISLARRYFNLGITKLLNNVSIQLEYEHKAKALSPIQIIKVLELQNEIKLSHGNPMNTFRCIQHFIELCKSYGFEKQYLVRANNCINLVLIENSLYFDALIGIEDNLRICREQHLQKEEIVCQLLKGYCLMLLEGNNHPKHHVSVLHHKGSISHQQGSVSHQASHLLQKHHLEASNPLTSQIISEIVAILSSIEESGSLQELSQPNICLFYEVKLLLIQNIGNKLGTSINLLEEYNLLKRQQFAIYELLLKKRVEIGNLSKIRSCLFKMVDFAMINPTLIEKGVGDRVQNTLRYIEKVINTMSFVDYEVADIKLLHQKVLAKLRKIYSL